MDNYVTLLLLVLYALVVWYIAARRYYELGYNDAIEDIEKLSLAVKKEIEKRQKNEE